MTIKWIAIEITQQKMCTVTLIIIMYNRSRLQCTHTSLYHLADSKLQLNYDLEEWYKTDDWKSTNSHKDKLVIAYDNKVGNRTLHPRVFYALYIRPNNIRHGHLIYRLSTYQILVTKEYQSVPVSDDLIEATKKTNSYDNRIKVMHLKEDHSTVQDDHSSKHNRECHTHIHDTDDSKDRRQDESDCPPQLNRWSQIR